MPQRLSRTLPPSFPAPGSGRPGAPGRVPVGPGVRGAGSRRSRRHRLEEPVHRSCTASAPRPAGATACPITAQDFVFTHECSGEPTGSGEVTAHPRGTSASARSGQGRSARPLQQLAGFFPHVLPAHAIRGEEFATVWSTGSTTRGRGGRSGAGPCCSRWERGRELRHPQPTILGAAPGISRPGSSFAIFSAPGTPRESARDRGEIDMIDPGPRRARGGARSSHDSRHTGIKSLLEFSDTAWLALPPSG